MSKGKESVDFDFFDTPRNDDVVHHVPHIVVEKRKDSKRSTEKNGHISSDSYTSDSDSYSDSSDSNDETARSKDYRPIRKGEQVVVKNRIDSDSDTGSSSAYSDGSDSEDDSPRGRKKQRKYDSKQQRQAWGMNGSANHDRPKSAKLRGRPKENSHSRSDSDSEITDVSPLNSPRSTPTHSKKNGKESVQYTSKEKSRDSEIQLQNDKIDLNLLMQAVSEIDKQERLKANSRRVMFEPPNGKTGQKNHYSFSKGRVTDIEKENQRLLQQIMQHIGPKQKRSQPKVSYPIARVDRLTSSAVNRRRQQSQIEQENMKLLNRLQKAKASKGLSRKEQLTDYSKTTLYGVPIAAVHEQMAADRLDSTYMQSTSSLNSTFGMSPARRSRPSSAKSNASSMRPGSAKSTVSMMSTASRLSRPGSAKSYKNVENRPAWDDRFAYS